MKKLQIMEKQKLRSGPLFRLKSLAHKSLFYKSISQVVSPRILYLKNEIRLLFKSRIFQIMFTVPCVYFVFKSFLYARNKYSEGGGKADLGYPENHPV